MWRNGDAMVECFGGSKTASHDRRTSWPRPTSGLRALLAPPFMHGAGHWMSFRTWLGGGTVCIPSRSRAARPRRHLGLGRAGAAELPAHRRRRVRPPAARRARAPADYDLSSLTVLLSGGAPLSAKLKEEFLRHLPTLMIVDGLGLVGGRRPDAARVDRRRRHDGHFPITPGNHVLCGRRSTVSCEPGDAELGWLAKSGRLALGYLGDRDKTARTYPVVDGVRYAVPGDRARLLRRRRDRAARARRGHDQLGWREDLRRGGRGRGQVAPGGLRLRRRRAAERALGQRGRRHRPRAARRRRQPHDELRAEAERHIARYKLPKATVFVDEVVRSPAGKADYRWAREVAPPPAARGRPRSLSPMSGPGAAGTATRCPRATRSGRRCATCSTPSRRATTSSTGS